MNFDCLIIGGGISGLTCGIKCAKEGLTCGIISSGMSALHFSSGSIDLMGYDQNHRAILSPFDHLENFVLKNPNHPYAKCGIDTIYEGMFFLKDEVSQKNLELFHNKDKNHFHVTSLGTVKPSFFSQKSVFNKHIKSTFGKRQKIAIINVDGFRDFHPGLTVSNLKKHELFKDVDFITGTIKLPDFQEILKNPYEFRSIDVSRIFDTGLHLKAISKQIKDIAGDAQIMAIPAFLGIHHFNKTIQKLGKLTDLVIYEIPTLPPSILGMRLDNALKSRFAELGGVFIAGDRVTGGEFEDGSLRCIYSQNNMETPLTARFFVLSTGSFFSGGMISTPEMMMEPVFNLALDYDSVRNNWHSSRFFSKNSHPFLKFGVQTNSRFNPFDHSGKPIENLFCTGAILSQYDPIKEGTGCGVAICTSFIAAKQIIHECKQKQTLS